MTSELKFIKAAIFAILATFICVMLGMAIAHADGLSLEPPLERAPYLPWIGGYYAAPAPWWGPQRYGIPSGPQCRSPTGMRHPGWCNGLPVPAEAYPPPPPGIPLPPPGGGTFYGGGY
jgi:hypothetical protein